MKYGCRNSCFSLFVNQPSGPKSDGTIRIIVFVFINCINSGGRGMNGRIGLFVMFELSNLIHLMMIVIIINKYYDSFFIVLLSRLQFLCLFSLCLLHACLNALIAALAKTLCCFYLSLCILSFPCCCFNLCSCSFCICSSYNSLQGIHAQYFFCKLWAINN